jgi:hypothetical protein
MISDSQTRPVLHRNQTKNRPRQNKSLPTSRLTAIKMIKTPTELQPWRRIQTDQSPASPLLLQPVLLDYWASPINHPQNINYADRHRLSKAWFYFLSFNTSSQSLRLPYCIVSCFTAHSVMSLTFCNSHHETYIVAPLPFITHSPWRWQLQCLPKQWKSFSTWCCLTSKADSGCRNLKTRI